MINQGNTVTWTNKDWNSNCNRGPAFIKLKRFEASSDIWLYNWLGR